MQTSIAPFLEHHSLPLLFGAVLIDQMGVPLPAIPWLLAVGALSATGACNPFLAIGLTVLACLVADSFWFYLGRVRGNRVLRLLCRISLEPDTCVRQTENMFTRYGLRSYAVVKFLPGFLSTVAPALAGASKMKVRRFLFYDGIGSLLYGACFIVVGYCFSNQIQQITDALASIGGKTLGLLAIVLGAYLGIKYWRRQRLLRELRMARITVSDLHRKQAAGEALTILDLRSNVALEEDPTIIPGAIRATLDDIKHGNHKLPRDQEIIVYCSCPNEATAARVALLLQRSGFKNVRPLFGGIDAWKEQKYPMEAGNINLTDLLHPSSQKSNPDLPLAVVNSALTSVEVKSSNSPEGTNQ
jgi:membrane protein DedA with SNARE-associated domain/rhodanese-related sulfurtransferase